MKEREIKRLAWILVNQSTKVKAKEEVIITGYVQAKPLLMEIHREVLRRGAYPRMKVLFEDFAFDYFHLAGHDQLTHLSRIDMYEISNVDVVIAVGGNLNTMYLAGVHPKRFALRQKTMKPYFDRRVDKTRWVVTRFPTSGLAQNAGMSLQQYKNFFYRATNKNWKEEGKKQLRIKRIFDRARKVRIVGRDTDLTVDVAKKKGIRCYGKFNMPDGEVFYSPNERLTEGFIRFTYPAIYNGHEVESVKFWFERGRVVRFSCSTGRSFMKHLLDTDLGARYLGEFGIGTNYSIKRFTRDLLIDEKMGGTVHLALGRAYKENEGTNKSAIHWDMIKDLRKRHGGGEIYCDNKLVMKDGKLV